MIARRLVQLVVSLLVLGLGVSLLLDTRLGADGMAVLIDGLSIKFDTEFVIVNVLVSAVFVAVGWLKGRVPGIGTIALPVLGGGVVSLLAPRLPEPESLGLRWLEFAVAFVLVCLGVAGYLATDLGAGPTEVAALAWDPPIPFRWSYSAVQVISGLIGWWGGADLGPGTVIVVLLIGPVVDRLVPILTYDTKPSATNLA